MRKVYILHRWDGSPKEPMHLWLKKKLEEEGFIVVSGPPPETMNGYEFDNKEEQPATQLTETPAPPSATEAPAA